MSQSFLLSSSLVPLVAGLLHCFWSRDNIVPQFGNVDVATATIPYADVRGERTGRDTRRKLMDDINTTYKQQDEPAGEPAQPYGVVDGRVSQEQQWNGTSTVRDGNSGAQVRIFPDCVRFFCAVVY